MKKIFTLVAGVSLAFGAMAAEASKVAYLCGTMDAEAAPECFYTALVDAGFNVTPLNFDNVALTGDLEADGLSGYDLVVLAGPTGSSATVASTFDKIVGKVPVLSTKAFWYAKTSPKGTNGGNPGSASAPSYAFTVAAEWQQHPIFKGVTMTSGEVVVFNEEGDHSNGRYLQSNGSFAADLDITQTTITAINDAQVIGEAWVNEKGWMILPVDGAFTKGVTSDGQKLFANAAAYLIAGVPAQPTEGGSTPETPGEDPEVPSDPDPEVPADNYDVVKVWDLTTWSQETKDNMKADELWVNLSNKNQRYSYKGAIETPSQLVANEVIVAETEGLWFNDVNGTTGDTFLVCYAMGEGKDGVQSNKTITITIKDLKAGDVIEVDLRASSSSATTLQGVENLTGEYSVTTSGALAELKVIADGDVTLSNLSAGAIFRKISIKREKATESIISVAGEMADDAMFDIMGRKVDNNYRGIVIKGGKKYINR